MGFITIILLFISDMLLRFTFASASRPMVGCAKKRRPILAAALSAESILILYRHRAAAVIYHARTSCQERHIL